MATIIWIFNRLTFHYNQWGELLQQKWSNLLNIIGDDDKVIWILMPTLIVFVSFWLYSIPFILMDITGKPQRWRKYKIQVGTNEPVDKHKVWKAIKRVLLNQLIVTPAFLYTYYALFANLIKFPIVKSLPTLPTLLIDLTLMSVTEEALFYYSHRILHHRLIYKYFHKIHHEWTSPVAIVSLYSHPFEHVFSNVGPILLLMIIYKPHAATLWLFSMLAILNAMRDHSGYNFPGSPKTIRFHDLHHAKFNCNFGVYGWLDKFHGTYKEEELSVKEKD